MAWWAEGMNAVLRKPMTVAEFLAWEARQDMRHDFDGFRPVAMTGGTDAHATIQLNLPSALHARLRGGPYRPYGSDMKTEIAGRVRYPDALIVCAPVSPAMIVMTEPRVVFEILSQSTANVDLVDKNAEYRATPSIQCHVILQQTHAAAIVFTRKRADWVTDIVTGKGAILQLPEVGIEVSLAELYVDVSLADSASRE